MYLNFHKYSQKNVGSCQVFSIKGNIKAGINLGVAGLPFHSFAKSGIVECDPKLQQTLI